MGSLFLLLNSYNYCLIYENIGLLINLGYLAVMIVL